MPPPWAAKVEVDPELEPSRSSLITSIDDCGRAVNPMLLLDVKGRPCRGALE
jgi:CO/xanthine dehydrogenase Mo-binding subunit